MGGTGSSRSRRRYRRAHRLRSGRRGVVAVIGTLLALLVFFALFGIFLTQYLPLWMTDNEAAFTNAAATSFLSFKSGVDSQYSLGVPPVLGTPFTISSQGVALLAQPTEASLTFVPQTCPSGFYTHGTSGVNRNNLGQPINPAYCVFENQTMTIGPGGSKLYTQSVPSGVLQMQLPNRYYSSENFYYEDDGVIQSQSQGYQLMAFAPPFNVTRVGTNTTVTSSFLQLYGNSTTVLGQGSEEVYSHLRFDQLVTSNGKFVASNSSYLPFVYSFEVGTLYPCAWAKFLSSQMNQSGVPTKYYNWTNPVTMTATVPYSGSCYNPTLSTYEIVLNVNVVNYAILYYAGVQVTLGVGSS